MKERTLGSDFTSGNIPKQLVIFSTPMFIGLVFYYVGSWRKD